MSNLEEIEHRHEKDRWRDAGFVVLAALLVAIAVGAVTRSGIGQTIRKDTWTVTVVESPVEIVK